jgi:ankyrin repeat protein
MLHAMKELEWFKTVSEETVKQFTPIVHLCTPVYRFTCLHYACMYDANLAVVLVKYGACVNAQTTGGSTPLHVACEYQPNLVKFLILHGADVNITRTDGIRPIDVAKVCHPEVIPYLTTSS